jgi:hypothetical protein
MASGWALSTFLTPRTFTLTLLLAKVGERGETGAETEKILALVSPVSRVSLVQDVGTVAA